MLKTKITSLLLAVVLLFGVPVMASAAVIDPYDLAGNIIADGANDLLTISFPTDNFYWRALHDGSQSHTGYGQTFSYKTQMRYVDNDTVYFHPFGKDTFFPAKGVADDGAFDINISLPLVVRDATQTYGVTGKLYAWFRNADGTNNSVVLSTVDFSSIQTNVSVVPRFNLQDLTLDLAGVDYFNFYVVLDFYGVANESDTASVEVSCNSSIDLKMRISSFYRQNANNEEMKGIMNEIHTQLDDQGQTLDDILKQQESNGDKLDDMNQNIESLPGEIGDQMQGIIDTEKDEAKGEGNKFVDQILSALPDPSQNVLAALKALPDAMAYTGTDATMQIPALVMPAVGDLVPETELWQGGQLQFDEYVAMLPPTLLSLVQSLFTIAIVLYCVYELKGLISYCLTLRESKGG